MPIYAFLAEDGELREEYFPMEGRPHLGETIDRGGKLFTRIFNGHLSRARDENWLNGSAYPYVSFALPKNCPPEIAKRKDPKGRPIITSKRHEREVAARMNLEKM